MADIVKANQSVSETMHSLIAQPAIKSRFDEILGRRAPQFISSIISIVNADQNLSIAFKDNPMSVLQVALKAAIYNLPLGNELGLAYILPFRNYKTNKSEAQFIIGYKGQIQLALRTHKYKRLGAIDIRQGELKSYDYLYGDTEIDWIKDPNERAKSEIIGYLAGFRTVDGFEKQLFKTVAEINEHEQKTRRGQYQSKTWKENFDVMARKTVLLMLLKTYAPKNPEDIAAAEIDDWFEGSNNDSDPSPAAPSNSMPPDFDVTDDVNPATGEIITA